MEEQYIKITIHPLHNIDTEICCGELGVYCGIAALLVDVTNITGLSLKDVLTKIVEQIPATMPD